MADDGWKMPNIGDIYTIGRDKFLSPILGKNHRIDLRVSKKISKPNKATVAITDYLDSTQLYSMIEDGDGYQKKFFTILLKDPSLITEIKHDTSWKELFDRYKMNQTLSALPLPDSLLIL